MHLPLFLVIFREEEVDTFVGVGEVVNGERGKHLHDTQSTS